jgi:hypothetical protein
MKRLILPLAFTIGAFAHADATQLLGRWISSSPVYASSGINFYVGMNFINSSSSVMSTVCEFPGGKRLEATVSVAVQVTDTAIQTLAPGHNQVSEGSLSCSVDVTPDGFQYQVVGSTLHLISGGNTLDLTRRP